MSIQHIKLGGLVVSRTGLGTMWMSAACTGAGAHDAESIRTIYRPWTLPPRRQRVPGSVSARNAAVFLAARGPGGLGSSCPAWAAACE